MENMAASLANEKLTDVGKTLAHSYYLGYLKLLLNGQSQGQSFKDRIQKFETDHQLKLHVAKLVLLIPNFGFFVDDFEAKTSGRMQRAGALQSVLVSRAGMKERPYGCQVYSLKDAENKNPIYITLDMPSILLTLYELFNNKKDELAHEVSCFSKTLKNLLENDQFCKDNFHIINYNAEDGDLVDVIRKELY